MAPSDDDAPLIELSPPEHVRASFRPGPFFASLATRTLGRALFLAPSLESTQTFLSDRLSAYRSVTVVADEQSSGRGRGSNQWVTPQGALAVSFSLPHIGGATLPHLQYLVGMAACRATEGASGVDLGVRLKWPNDLWAGREAKVGGVLCQSAWDGQRFHVIVGMGLNVSNPSPTTSLKVLAERVGAPPPGREQVLALFFNALEQLHLILEERGWAPLDLEYRSRWLHTGQRLELRLDPDSAMRWVVVEGVAPSGYLLAREEEGGALLELHPDSTRLNFWDGFIARKL